MRYVKTFQINAEPQAVHTAINQYLQSEGFEYINYKGEIVFKKGFGIVSGPTFFKFLYSANTVRMETWMKFALFPGVYVGELGVKGFIGCAAKGPWKNRIKYLENLFESMTQKTVSAVFCINCGTQLSDGAAFCSVCGKKRYVANAAEADEIQNTVSD